jgi:hypothetical protein
MRGTMHRERCANSRCLVTQLWNRLYLVYDNLAFPGSNTHRLQDHWPLSITGPSTVEDDQPRVKHAPSTTSG